MSRLQHDFLKASSFSNAIWKGYATVYKNVCSTLKTGKYTIQKKNFISFICALPFAFRSKFWKLKVGTFNDLI